MPSIRASSAAPVAAAYKSVQLEELRIVVEHFFEVRDEPARVDGVAREASAEMVVDAALAHPLEA